ncbi:uncharacterized protein MYCFIDRAFT_81946 [Pseudocercospora fijiensis CIRAD86]|uniref:Peptidase M24 domain-containing protein n=1 Tax=Pseudocercospora fijiensis (strain CIRAD86) TaxID=383855 RepID=M3AN09_PSEFD|nr:uncharacterized protein MYCFIDRAFT_81946 [Pseudocercospora fijiensis CIRAD86]EME85986.1 hypothetical protein MYCFIDRAFT_81946 [Pseudocercospora fijiensis CIRAD86]
MATETITIEQDRAHALRDAERKAAEMFKEIGSKLIRPGVSEKQISDEIHQMGKENYGVRTHWHKRLIRSGPNTLAPFAENPPDRIVEKGDVLVIDLGPVFEAWEADFGRTYIIETDDAEKIKLRDALEPMWYKIKAKYDQNPSMTGGELFEIAKATAAGDGWKWGAHLAGHIVGDFPHERIPNDKITNYIVEGNDQKMDGLDKKGHKRHWILEVHLRPQHEEYGGFFEQILTVN